ncbi:MAG: toprim domain-containing protein [Rhizobiaceae bacterium]
MRYEGFIEDHFQIKNKYGSEAICLCIFHEERSASLQINMESGLFLCFSCGSSGGPRSLMSELGLSFIEPDDDLKSIMKNLIALDRKRKSDEEKVLPESFLDQFRFETDEWKKRDISGIFVRKFRLGFSPLQQCLTIPVRNVNGELLGVIRRNLNWNDNVPKYSEPLNVKKSNHLWGAPWVAREPDAHTVVLVEGPLDAVKVWQAGWPALAVCGSSLSRAQALLLRRLDVRQVYLFFDNDAAGRKAGDSCLGFKHNVRNGKKITKYVPEIDLRIDFDVRRVTYRDVRVRAIGGGLADDPGEMYGEGIETMLRNATKVT